MAAVGNLTLSYAAGALSTLSPCVLPLLPIILFGVLERHVWGPLALAAGLSASFAAVGTAVAALGFGIGINPAAIRIGVAALMLSMGVVLLVPVLQSRLAFVAAPIAAGGHTLLSHLQLQGIGGQFVLGALLGAIWSPCAGPTLGAAIGLAAQGASLSDAAATMMTFGLGAATPILVLAYGSRQAIATRRNHLARLSALAKPLIGATFIATGVFVLTGLDKLVEASLTRAMPDWLVTVTTRL